MRDYLTKRRQPIKLVAAFTPLLTVPFLTMALMAGFEGHTARATAWGAATAVVFTEVTALLVLATPGSSLRTTPPVPTLPPGQRAPPGRSLRPVPREHGRKNRRTRSDSDAAAIPHPRRSTRYSPGRPVSDRKNQPTRTIDPRTCRFLLYPSPPAVLP